MNEIFFYANEKYRDAIRLILEARRPSTKVTYIEQALKEASLPNMEAYFNHFDFKEPLSKLNDILNINDLKIVTSEGAYRCKARSMTDAQISAFSEVLMELDSLTRNYLNK